MRTHSDEADHHSSVIMSAYEIVSFGKTKKKKKKKRRIRHFHQSNNENDDVRRKNMNPNKEPMRERHRLSERTRKKRGVNAI